MTTPRDNEAHIKRVIQESETLTVALKKLGLDYFTNYEWIAGFANKNGLKTKPFTDQL